MKWFDRPQPLWSDCVTAKAPRVPRARGWSARHSSSRAFRVCLAPARMRWSLRTRQQSGRRRATRDLRHVSSPAARRHPAAPGVLLSLRDWGLPRIADVEAADFDGGGDLDLLVSAFG
jgi:hypothetical protein